MERCYHISGGVSPLCILRGCGVVAVEDTEEGAAEPVGRQRARPQLCLRFSASEGAVQGHQVGRSPQGEAWALPQHSSCKIRCGIERGSKGQHLRSLNYCTEIFYVFLTTCHVLLAEPSL